MSELQVFAALCFGGIGGTSGSDPDRPGPNPIPQLTDYAEAARQSALELKTAFIDLNAMSISFYESLEAHGPDYSRKALARTDNTHHQAYGSYQLAKFIVKGIRESRLPLAKRIVKDYREADPAKPDPVDRFVLPVSPLPARNSLDKTSREGAMLISKIYGKTAEACN